MLHWSHHFHAQGSRFAFKNACPTAKAFLWIRRCLQFLLGAIHAYHVDGTEYTECDTYLAAGARFLVYLCLEAALGPELADVTFMGIEWVSDHTAIYAATAEHSLGHTTVVAPLMHQSIFLNLIYKSDYLIVRELSSCVPRDGIRCATVEL